MCSFTTVTSPAGPSWRRTALAVALLTLLPAAALAQNGGGGRRGGGGGMAGVVGAAEMRPILDDMDLSADKQATVDDLLDKAQASNRQAMQGLRDASPEERQQKVQDIIKSLAETKTKVEAELTPAQKTEFAKKLAGLSVARATAAVAAERKATADVDVPADKKTQLGGLFDDTTKALDGYKADADAVTDDAAGTALAQKVQRTFQSTNQQLNEILGPDDARTVVQAGRQAMRPAPGGAGGRRRAAAATEPAK